MNKYGRIPPRLLECFGVSGALGENCHIFYSVLFSTRHVGKVSDLLTAKLQEAGVENFQLRIAILVEVFKVAHSIQGAWMAPLNIECGIDEEKVAIGVSFVLPPELTFDPDNFISKIGAGGDPAQQGPLENLSRILKSTCDRLIIKFEPVSRRYETITIVPLMTELSLEDRAIPADPVFLILTEDQAKANPPKAGVYTELGDLDYNKLLQDDKTKKAGKPIEKSMGQHLVEAAEEESVKQKIRREAKVAEDEAELVKGLPKTKDKSQEKFEGDASEDSSSKVAGGKGQKGDPNQNVKGVSDGDDESKKIKGAEEDAGIVEKIMGALGMGEKSKTQTLGGKDKGPEAQKTRIAGDSEELKQSKQKVKALEEKMLKLQNELLKRSSVKAEVAPQKQVIKASSPQKDEDDEEVIVVKGTKSNKPPLDELEADEGPGVLEKIMGAMGIGAKKPAKKITTKQKKEILETDVESIDESTGELIGKTEKRADGEPAPAVAEGDVETLQEAAKDAESLMKQTDSLDAAILKAKEEIKKLKDELKNPRAQKFVDGFMQEVIQEKAKIQEMAKKMNLSIRQKEYEFKAKERLMQEEVRKRDEEIKLKTTTIARSKERATQLQAALDQVKGSNTKSDEAFKAKYINAQKLSAQAQEQNQVLNQTIADMKAQMLQLKSRVPGNSTQMTELKTKFERSQKQIDEYKKMNQQLLDKLNDASSKKPAATGSVAVEEMKKKMEGALKLAQEQKGEAETLKIKVEELQAETSRLQKEFEAASKKAA